MIGRFPASFWIYLSQLDAFFTNYGNDGKGLETDKKEEEILLILSLCF